MRVHLINLDESEDRLAEFKERNRQLTDVIRFPAIVGRKVSPEKLVRAGVMSRDIPPYGKGAIGNALSHLSLWKLAIDQSAVVTIAEDDAVFHHTFEAKAEAHLRSLPEAWDIVLWGWNFDSVLLFDFLEGVSPCVGRFSQPQLRLHLKEYQSLAIQSRLYPLQIAFGIMAYSVSPAGALKLAEHCLPIRKMDVFCPGLNRAVTNSTIDIMMNALYPKINSYVCFPPLAVTSNDKDRSTVVPTKPDVNSELFTEVAQV